MSPEQKAYRGLPPEAGAGLGIDKEVLEELEKSDRKPAEPKKKPPSKLEELKAYLTRKRREGK